MGTKVYMAPEVYNASEMPCKGGPADIFSLGVLFFMMAFGAPPFQSAEYSDSYFSFIKMRPGNTDFFRFHPHTRGLFGKRLIPESFMNLLLSMLRAEPSQRIPDIQSIRAHEFFSEFEKSGMSSKNMDGAN